MGHQVEWEIEWTNSRNDTAGNPQGEPEAIAGAWSAIQGNHLTRKPLGLFARQCESLYRTRNFKTGFPDDFTLLESDCSGQFITALFNQVCSLFQNQRSVVARN